MTVQCPKCEKKIDSNYIKNLKNIENFKCPSCKVELEESGKTKIIAMLIAIIPIIGLAFIIKNFFVRLVVVFIWAFISTAYIRPAVAKYNIVKK